MMKKKKGYRMGGKMMKKGYSKGVLVGKQKNLDKNNDGKISGDDFKMMKTGGMMKKGYKMGGKMKKGYANGGKVRGSGIAKKGVRPVKMR